MQTRDTLEGDISKSFRAMMFALATHTTSFLRQSTFALSAISMYDCGIRRQGRLPDGVFGGTYGAGGGGRGAGVGDGFG